MRSDSIQGDEQMPLAAVNETVDVTLIEETKGRGFNPRWSFVAVMLTMLWLQGWHYNYGLDSYNRLKHILKARYGYSDSDMIFYAQFISAGFVAGFTFGRLLGSYIV